MIRADETCQTGMNLAFSMDILPNETAMGFFKKKTAKPMSSLDPDAIDLLRVVSMEENSDSVEKAVRELQQEARNDEKARALLSSIFYEEDRELSFRRYGKSRDLAATLRLFEIFGVSPSSRIIEVGAGPGFLASALNRLKYPIEILEPSTHWTSGTGYLRTREEDKNIPIHTDHVSWHGCTSKYDVIVTKNCIHHFQNISQVAVCLRQKLSSDGLWISIREWFADSARELADSLAHHPFRVKNPVIYEWPYPAHHYAEALELAGLSLVAVVPNGYANGCMGTYSEEPGSPKNNAFTEKIDRLLAGRPEETVKAFWNEVKKNKFEGGTQRIYTRPQVMIFKKGPGLTIRI